MSCFVNFLSVHYQLRSTCFSHFALCFEMFRLCTVTGVMVSELRRNNAVSVRNKKVGHCLCRHAVSVCPSVRPSVCHVRVIIDDQFHQTTTPKISHNLEQHVAVVKTRRLTGCMQLMRWKKTAQQINTFAHERDAHRYPLVIFPLSPALDLQLAGDYLCW